MALPREYTRGRRNAMQATMFFILLGVVGLAALVDRQIGAATIPPLGPERTSGPLHFRLPSTWAIISDPNPQPGVIAEATQGRLTLKVFRQRLRRLMSPEDYLERSDMLSDIFAGDTPPDEVDHVTMGGAPALRVRGQVQYETPLAKWIESETVQCAVFPNRQAVTLWLSDRGEETDADAILLDYVAATVRVDQ